MEKYKVTNRLEQRVRYNDIIFGSKETKVMDNKPTSDKFIVEKITEIDTEKKEKKQLNNGGKK